MPIVIGVWCNGNTADSGPAFPGSSPGTPTDRIAKMLKIKHLAIFLFLFSRDFPVKPNLNNYLGVRDYGSSP